jgi:hypothetical protein
VFIVMAIDAEVFPVWSIRRVIQVIAVFVVDGQEMPCFLVEFPAAFGADQSMNLERPFPVIAPFGGGFM